VAVAAVVALLSAAPGAVAKEFTPVTLPFGKASLSHFRSTLEADGMVAISDVPGLAEARDAALVAMARCVIMDETTTVAPVNLELKDGTKRASWAGYVQPGFVHEEMDNTNACPGLDAAMESLRSVVDVGSKYYAQLLDQAVRVQQFDQGLMQKTEGGSYNTFQELLNEAQHLDHFHVYERETTGQEDVQTLDLHTDHGLFIAIVPSVRVSRSSVLKTEDSFSVQTRDGQIAEVRLSNNGNVLVFMTGDGINYLKRHAHTPMRPVPHAVKIKSTAPERSVRAWFGRMFFAPANAQLSSNGDTFKSVIESAVKGGDAFPVLACSGSQEVDGTADVFAARSLQDHTANNCSAGQAYCWMGCQSAAHLNCTAEQAECRNNVTNELWVYCENCHDRNARLVCPSNLQQGSNAIVHSLNGFIASTLMVALAMASWF